MENQDEDKEFGAMRLVYEALKVLDASAQIRVLDYVCRRLSLTAPVTDRDRIRTPSPPQHSEELESDSTGPAANAPEAIEGISPIATKWMRRSGITSQQLTSLFSLGVDEIDLVAESVPGSSKAQRVKSVLLLLGVSSYLGSGVARVTDEKLRQACGHYDAYDLTNFAKQIKALNAEASGSRESGYTLTARGLTAATGLIKQMTSSK